MNAPVCGDIRPHRGFGPPPSVLARCTKRLGHAWDHRDETLPGEPSWPQVVLISGEDMAKMLELAKADGFKALGCLVTHCRCKELDP